MPGVYIFADKNGDPLYIGKSIDLKSRLSQHFENSHNPNTKAAHFIPKTATLTLQTVESDLAALILEANLIKIYQPYYNSSAKDDKTASYITISKGPKFNISIIHKSNLDIQSYGPYPSASVANLILKQVRHIFGYCQNPGAQKTCFYYHLHQCPGICNQTITASAYAKHITKIKIFLSGKFKNLIKSLTKEINLYAKQKNFEKANTLKHQLETLQISLNSRRYSQLLTSPSEHSYLKTIPHRIECYDMATLNQENTVGAMVVFIDGQPDKSSYRKFLVKTKQLGDPHTMRHIILRRLRHAEWDKPDLIILDGGIPQLSIVSEIIPKDIPVIALSKKRETIHFYDLNHQIVNLNLPLHSETLKLFQFARDEAHRFGNTYHKVRRKKDYNFNQ